MSEAIRVLLISHTCQSQDEGHRRLVELGRYDDVALRVIVPDRWDHYGKPRAAEPKMPGRYDYVPTPVRFPSVWPAQWYFHYYPSLGRILHEFRPHVIDLWEEPYSVVTAHAAWLRNRVLPEAWIVSETEQNLLKTLPQPFEWCRKYTLRHSDYLIGRSEEAVGVCREKGYVGPAESIPNAVDIARFAPMDRAACRAKYGMSGYVVGYVGRIIDWKGIDEIIAAMRLLPADVQLIVAGEGAMQPQLEALAREPAMVNRIHLVGQIAGDQLAGVMNAMDALLLPSRTTPTWKEQFGRVIIEAHACGVPVIGSDSGAIPAVVGEGGQIVPERDAAALAAAILRLRDAPELGPKMGAIGRRRAQAECTWAAVAARMHCVFQRVVANGPRTAASSAARSPTAAAAG